MTAAAGAPGVEQTASTTPAPAVSGMRADYPITAEGATAFIADAETKWAEVSEYVARIQWARATNITFDTMWLESKANAEATELQVQLANQAAKFNDVQVDPVVRRKLNLLRLSLVLPAPNRPGAAEELAQITTRLDSTYSTGKFDFKGRQITLDEASLILADSRDPVETKALYEGWRTISPVMRDDYARMVEIANEGSRELGFADTGALWRSGYDMPANDFAAETDRLWAQVKPFYENLHCYVRGKLNARELVGGKDKLRQMQTDFARDVGQPFGLERGQERSRATHQTIQEYYGRASTPVEADFSLPERRRGAVMGLGGESDREWQERASRAATERLAHLTAHLTEASGTLRREMEATEAVLGQT